MERETNNNYEKFTKRIEELRKKSTPKKDIDEFIKKSQVPRPPKPYEVNIDWENVPQLSLSNIIEFRDVDFSHGSNTIFDKIEFNISMGQKLIIVGPNGIGKTTLFKLASGLLTPNSGNIINDDRLRVGYYHQQIIDNLPLNLTPTQYLQTLNDRLDNGACRGILGKLGIKKTDTVDLPNIKINLLSGGQKARVSLASIQMNSPHLLLLDEPTNHLDLESIEGLIKGINEFNGGVVIITHDMYLIESINDGIIYEISNKKIKKFNGEFNDYCEKIITSK
jgi:ATPase subunit of ABC transporter with duplicated ATPase domains